MISAGFRLLGIACCVGAVGWPLSLSAVTPATPAQRVGAVAGAEKIAAPATVKMVNADSQHLADSSDAGKVWAGFTLYKTNCAQCHGRNLQGQPLWHLQDGFEHQRAPAHDDTGHTWQHPDEDLFQMIRAGRFPNDSGEGVSYMPAFGERLQDKEILEIISFMKSRWSLAMKVSQASLNPDFAGMPAGAATENWTLPLNCVTTAPSAQSAVSPSPLLAVEDTPATFGR